MSGTIQTRGLRRSYAGLVPGSKVFDGFFDFYFLVAFLLCRSFLHISGGVGFDWESSSASTCLAGVSWMIIAGRYLSGYGTSGI